MCELGELEYWFVSRRSLVRIARTCVTQWEETKETGEEMLHGNEEQSREDKKE